MARLARSFESMYHSPSLSPAAAIHSGTLPLPVLPPVVWPIAPPRVRRSRGSSGPQSGPGSRCWPAVRAVSAGPSAGPSAMPCAQIRDTQPLAPAFLVDFVVLRPLLDGLNGLRHDMKDHPVQGVSREDPRHTSQQDPIQPRMPSVRRHPHRRSTLRNESRSGWIVLRLGTPPLFRIGARRAQFPPPALIPRAA